MTNRANERQESQKESAEFCAKFSGSALPSSVVLGTWRTPTPATTGGSVFSSLGLFRNPGTLRLTEEVSNWSRQTILDPIAPSPEPPALTEYERQMTEFALEEEEGLKRLRKEYVLVNGPFVEAFLQGHRSLIEVLLDAAAHIRACFGADNVLQLRLGGEEEDAPPEKGRGYEKNSHPWAEAHSLSPVRILPRWFCLDCL